MSVADGEDGVHDDDPAQGAERSPGVSDRRRARAGDRAGEQPGREKAATRKVAASNAMAQPPPTTAVRMPAAVGPAILAMLRDVASSAAGAPPQ